MAGSRIQAIACRCAQSAGPTVPTDQLLRQGLRVAGPLSISHSASKLVVGARWIRASAVLNNHACGISTCFATVGNRQPLGQSRKEATDVRISSAISVNKLLLRQGYNWVFCHVPVDGYDCWVATLGDHNGALDARLCAGDQRESCRNEFHIRGLPPLRFCECSCFCLIAKEVIHHRQTF